MPHPHPCNSRLDRPLLTLPRLMHVRFKETGIRLKRGALGHAQSQHHCCLHVHVPQPVVCELGHGSIVRFELCDW
jgi:hypothetical protein